MVTKISAFKTTDGSIFESELDAYKHENMFLEKRNNETNGINIVLSNDFIKPITEINGIQLEKNIKSFDVKSILDSYGNCIPNNPIIYLWYNIIEKSPYIGSSKNPKNRVLNFIDFETFKYAGNKINNARERFKSINSLVWKLFILEENISEDLLAEREQFYINKFNSIKDGYNISNPAGVKCFDITYKKELSIQAYNSILRRIENWGMSADETISVEKFIENYVPNNNSNTNPYDALYFSFRLPCFMKNKNIVSFTDLIKLPRRVNEIIDSGKNGFRKEGDVYPTSMIRYRACDKVYLALNDVNKTFKTPYEAVVYRIKCLMNDVINNIDGKELDFIKSLYINDFIKLCYHDSDNIIKFLESSKKDFEDVENEIELSDCQKNIDEKKTHQTIEINGKILEYKRMFTNNDLLATNRYKHFKNSQTSVFMCYNTIEKMAFIGRTDDSVHSLAKFFYVGPFGGKKIDLVRKKYYDDKNAWLLFTLEENLPANELVETQKYYINLYDTISNGYNTAIPKDIQYERTGKIKINKSINGHENLIKNHYNIFIDNINNFGYKLSSDFTFDTYSDMFTHNFYKSNTDKYVSFRIPCILHNCNIVTQENICYLPYGISKHIDCLKTWEFNKTESGKLVPNFIRYNKHIDKYTAIGLCGRYYDSLKCALEAYLRMLLDKFENILKSNYLNFDIDAEIIEFLEKMNYETLLKTCFENSEKLIDILKKA